MKGVILKCLGDLVADKFGKENWEKALEKSGMNKKHQFLATSDVDDAQTLKIVGSVCETLGITLEQASDAFGEYWVTAFAPKIYGVYYKGIKSAKEFLKKMDSVHQITTQNIENARPPRFDYEEPDADTLIMTYKSQRGLIPIFMGLIKGVGKHYNQNLKVTDLGKNRIQIKFGDGDK